MVSVFRPHTRLLSVRHNSLRVGLFGAVQRLRPVLAIALLVIAAGSAAEPTTSRELANVPLLRELKGKVVLLDFWASWCEPCRQSFPWMNDLQRRYGERNLVVVAVNVDQDRKLAEQFLAATPAGFRVEYDPVGTLAEKLGVETMPMSFLIDANGTLRSRHAGFKDTQRKEREAAIVGLLEQ